ncbi:MAG: hypothetical protein JOZ69_08735, partial [Myxococcales bacterium]|nr:hypothetical protein [Myxococcales bacterium]
MNGKRIERAGLFRAFGVAALGAVVGAACLTRPVVTADPNLKTNFTSVIHNQSVDKLDLLFMIDNSASMGDKQALLAQAVPDMITRLVTPNCVDNNGAPIAASDAMGRCATGKLEFPPVHDMHIGIVSSSLGGRGGNECPPPPAPNPANPSLDSHNDDQGRLINRGGDDEHNVAKAGQGNFLAWFPANAANSGKTGPANAETTPGAPGMPGTLIGDFTDMISGVHEHGCGFEAQNEAWYRFLVQPDPFDSIVKNGARASLQGLDQVILTQRAAFLRPDSLLAVIVVTDENEEVANPLAVGGQGWLYENYPWPAGGGGTGGAPEGTIECQSNPNDPNCTSCAFSSVQTSSSFKARCPDDNNTVGMESPGTNGFLAQSNDQVNVRFFHQKQRFGVFAGYPLSRYVRGLTQPTVPDRNHEVD